MSRTDAKADWPGTLLAVQRRIRLMRSHDQRSHEHLGYVLRVRGTVAGEAREFAEALGKSAHEKHRLRAGDEVSGNAERVAGPRRETAGLYDVSGLRVLARSADAGANAPPLLGVPPSLEAHRACGHRRLAARTYGTRCSTCIWGCEMAVETIVDHWNSSVRRHRCETF